MEQNDSRTAVCVRYKVKLFRCSTTAGVYLPAAGFRPKVTSNEEQLIGFLNAVTALKLLLHDSQRDWLTPARNDYERFDWSTSPERHFLFL